MLFDLSHVSHPNDLSHAEDAGNSNLDSHGGDVSQTDHFHVAHNSQAVDTDSDGFSNALEAHYGTDPLNAASHPHLTGFDSDADGFSDVLETRFGTDAFDAAFHPDAFWAHHARLAPDVSVNFDGRIDVPFESANAS